MNNKELIEELSGRVGYTYEDTFRLLASLTDAVSAQLQEGRSLDIEGFGAFEVKKEPEHVVVNPLTKQRFLVPPKLVLNFRPSFVWEEKLKRMSGEHDE